MIVLGTDALLAAQPATPVQLAHACLLAGYSSVIPASWGDELVAQASLRALAVHGDAPVVQCSCPLVARRLVTESGDLRPFLVSLVAPPVALARYLRSAYGSAKLRITYVGRCPAATDEAIDARLTPEELLASFADHGIVLEGQPDAFDSVIPPDRRRFRSQPGGIPSVGALRASAGAPRSFVELHGTELAVELAQHLLAARPVLLDAATALGCVCSGATSGVAPTEARARVVALEPPRAPSPVLDERVAVELEVPLPEIARPRVDVVREQASPARAVESRSEPAERESAFDPSSSGTRRPSPPRGIARVARTGAPITRDTNGRTLPRTYVARRRLSSRVARPIEHTRITDNGGDPQPAPSEPSAAPQLEPRREPVGDGDSALRAEVSNAAATRRDATTTHRAMGGGDLAIASDAPPPYRPPSRPQPTEEEIAAERLRERSVALPVTALSDQSPRATTARFEGDGTRTTTAPVKRHERPVDGWTVAAATNMDTERARPFVLALVIALIVLLSAAAGLVIGRWMSWY